MKKIGSDNKKIKYKFLYVDGTRYRTTLSKKYKIKKGYSKPEKNKIYSFIPGTILKINVTEGQCVKKGDSLLVLEAMKMENIIISPLEGIVKSIKMKAGEKVSKGMMMIELGYPDHIGGSQPLT